MALFKRTFVMTIICVLTHCNAALCSYSPDSSWEAMIDGINTYSKGEKLRQEFEDLCAKNGTATVNGRYDTGSGLYMVMDVPVYDEPEKSKLTELKDRDTVVLAEEEAQVNGKEWVKIKFIFISDRAQAPVSIDEGWIEKTHLRFKE